MLDSRETQERLGNYVVEIGSSHLLSLIYGGENTEE